MIEHGLIIVTDPGADRPILEVGTLSCCHCGAHWIPKAGSKIKRGYCMRCNGYVCGPGCAECVPVDQMLSNLEAGRPANWRPIMAFVVGDVPE